MQTSLTTKYPVVIAYNGIHHYVSTFILDQKSKNSAILSLMKTMTQNVSEVSSGLAGRGANSVTMFFELENAITSGDLTKLAASSSVTSGTSSQASSQAPAPSGEKKYKCDQCPESFSRTNELQNHKVSKHGAGFICDLCEHEAFQSIAALKVHQTKSTWERGCKNVQV